MADAKDIGEYMQYYSQSKQRHYFVSKATGQSIWELPSDYIIPETTSAATAATATSAAVKQNLTSNETDLASNKRPRTDDAMVSGVSSSNSSNSSNSGGVGGGNIHMSSNSSSSSSSSSSLTSSNSVVVRLNPVRISEIPPIGGAAISSPWRRIDLVSDICPGLAEAYKTGQILDEKGQLGKFRSVISPLEGRVLYNLVVQNGYTRTLEIGMGCGATSAWICSAHQQTNARHQAIDAGQVNEYTNTGITLLKKCNLSQFNKQVIVEQPHVILPRIADNVSSQRQAKFHLIVLDGDLSFDAAVADFYYINLILEDNGVLVIPNVSHKPIEKLVSYIATNYATKYRFCSTRDGTRRWIAVFTKLPAQQTPFYRPTNSFTNFN